MTNLQLLEKLTILIKESRTHQSALEDLYHMIQDTASQPVYPIYVDKKTFHNNLSRTVQHLGKIAAIRDCREFTGMSLRDAKSYVEQNII